MALWISFVAAVFSAASATVAYRAYRTSGWRVIIEPRLTITGGNEVKAGFILRNPGRHDVEITQAYFADRAQSFTYCVHLGTLLPKTLKAGHAIGLVFAYMADRSTSAEFTGTVFIQLGDGKWVWRLADPLPTPDPPLFYPENTANLVD